MIKKLIIITIITFISVISFSQTFNVLTNINAVNLVSGYSGDGGLAKFAEHGNVPGIAFDSHGNTYFIDHDNYVIRKIEKTSGIITTIIGNKLISQFTVSSTAHNEPTNVGIGQPDGIAIDNQDNLYFSSNHSICKFNLINNALTIFINSSNNINPTTLRFDDVSFNYLFFYDQTTQGIRAVRMSNGSLYNNIIPQGNYSWAIYGNNIYYEDNATIYKYNLQTSITSVYFTTLPRTTANYQTLHSVACDHNGDVYCVISDVWSFSQDLFKFTNSTQTTGIAHLGSNSCFTPKCLNGLPASHSYVGNNFSFDLCNNVYMNCGNFIGVIIKSNPFGTIMHPTSVPIQNVNVDITGTQTQSLFSTNGIINWSPRQPTAPASYTITPSKNNDIKKANGVSTLDITLIQRHILAYTYLDDAKKCIAADVNNDGIVSTNDILNIKSLILAKSNTFTGDRLWAFIDKTSTFSHPSAADAQGFQFCTSCSTPSSFRESFSKTVNNATCVTTGVDFWGVKLGDVNYDAKPPFNFRNPVGIYYDQVNATNVETGGNITVPIRVKSFNNLVGMQYTLNFNPANLQYIGVESHDEQLSYNDTQAEQGKLSFLWADSTTEGVSLEDGSVIYNLVFKKLQSIKSQDLVLTSDITDVEAVNSELQIIPIEKPLGSIVDKSNGSIEDMHDRWNIIPPYSVIGDLIIKSKISVEKEKTVLIRISDQSMENVYSQETVLHNGDNFTYISLRSLVNLPKGIYNVTILGLETDLTQTFFVGDLDVFATPQDIATGNIAVPSSNSELTLYALQAQLYKDIKTNPDLQADASLQTFASNYASSNYEYIARVDNLLSTGDIHAANTILDGWTSNNVIDNNYKQYYNWVIGAMQNNLTSTDISDIFTLAQSCPLTAGMVVYSARDLYNSMIEDNLLFEDNCPINNGRTVKQITNVNKKPLNNLAKSLPNVISNDYTGNDVITYPNPTTGIINIKIPTSEKGAKQIVVTDVYGKTIQSMPTNENFVSFQLKAPSGLYFVKVTNAATGKTYMQKVLLNK